jgi:D-lactate dehydrogenase
MKHPDKTKDLHSRLPHGHLSTKNIHRVAYSCDASVYRMIPEAVAWPRHDQDICSLLAHAREHRTSVTFRAGGTSLSGQAVTDGILVDLSRHWRSAEILEGGDKIRVKPGIVGAHVNDQLSPLGRKIGPDPASISCAMMGGILANNSSGMCCGTEQNAYQTLESMSVILASGTIIDSSLPNADEILKEKEPALYAGLLQLRSKVLNNSSLSERIRRKYRYKNTTGYGLNALLDFERPIDILIHLMIGSEGTLGFISHAVLKTVPLNPYASTGLLFFDSVVEACRATLLLRDSGAAAIELMDRAALRSVENQQGAPELLRTLPQNATSLLVEYQAKNLEQLSEFSRNAQETEKQLHLFAKQPFTTDAALQQALWKIRKGTFPSVGAARQPGTAVIIEDVLFPQEALAAGLEGLQKLFLHHGYKDANIFGHAKDGNMHFVLSQAFDSAHEIARYDRFMRDVVKLVVHDHEGALKAEHGTGRNMAPFVAEEWGTDGFAVMKELKKLFDPLGILNRGVIISNSNNSHLEHLKDLPPIDDLVDKCIECGYCEPICPSEKLTLSPRRRIIVGREIQRERTLGHQERLNELKKAYVHEGIDTCATDGLCATTCPVGINTGLYVKSLRKQSHGKVANQLAKCILKSFHSAEALVRTSLKAGHIFSRMVSHAFLHNLSSLPQKIFGINTPTWTRWMPLPAYKNTNSTPKTEQPVAVIFPTCVTRTMGSVPNNNHSDRSNTLIALCQKANVSIFVPEKPEGLCCGMPFFSKGFPDEGKKSLELLVDALWIWTNSGTLPLVIDNSPCTLTIQEQSQKLSSEHLQKLQKIQVLDIIEFTHDFLLPKLNLKKVEETAFVYPVCSVTKMNLTPKLRTIAELCALTVVMPLRPACCGQAGDRGFSFPDLTASATKKIEWEKSCQCANPEGRYATSRTCEIALSENAGAAYDSILELVRKSAQ